MIKFIRQSKKGVTVIEVLIAMAVFGVISVPLMGIFLDSMVATKIAQDKIETNALISVVTDSVTNNVKGIPGGKINDLSGREVVLNNISGPGISTGSTKDLRIEDKNNKNNNENVYNRYTFDAERIVDFGGVSCGAIIYPDTCEYQITIKSRYKNVALQKFRIFISRVN